MSDKIDIWWSNNGTAYMWAMGCSIISCIGMVISSIGLIKQIPVDMFWIFMIAFILSFIPFYSLNKKYDKIIVEELKKMGGK